MEVRTFIQITGNSTNNHNCNFAANSFHEKTASSVTSPQFHTIGMIHDSTVNSTTSN